MKQLQQYGRARIMAGMISLLTYFLGSAPFERNPQDCAIISTDRRKYKTPHVVK